MKLPIKIVPLALAVGLLSCRTASAGTYTNDFSQWSGFTPDALGVAFLTNQPVNCMVLTPAAASLGGSITLDNFDSGQAIESFTAVFKLQLGPGSTPPADGVSFNFGPGIFPGLVSSEEGINTGAGAITIAWDTYDNGLAAEQVPTPSLDIIFGGKVIVGHPFTDADMVTSQPEDVKVQLNRAGKVSVWYKGQLIHDNVFVPGWAPTYGLFNFSGRTGGSFEFQAVSSLGVDTVLQGAAVLPTVTANPQNANANEGGSATFTVGVDGTAPFTFQWYKNNVAIQDATNVTLVINPVHFTDNNATIKCAVTNPAGTVNSGPATLTVVRDTTPPTVVKAVPNSTGTQLIITYSEPVSDTALVTANYSINQGITISGVTRQDASHVVLNISTLPGGQSFILTINNVQDMASSPPNTIAANTHVPFNSFLFQLGAVIHKVYRSNSG